ncbi:hypothetical protein KGF57_003683 [Candida theae]|uniref:protein-histidine N-methyltransferase n=1 Tax=Candida theae TaxID=1198502 RepID=A0AAD5FXR2_9ASCO|nr:uncharacterized protein KGF57_003683 [Candida theae]KAI5955550.1 hypothetical protein KGF57_003683 [Candida theae]
MSFAFGFTDEDLNDVDIHDTKVEPTSKGKIESALETFNVLPEHQPRIHCLSSILQTLEGVRLTFDNYITAGGHIVYRRELYDVKHQIMMEEKDVSSKLSELLIERNDADVQSNVYEGGFKSWECSFDVVDAIHAVTEKSGLLNSSILELGCGTALPSCYIIKRKFEERDHRSMSLLVSDFNFEVLRLVTIPNIMINWASTLAVEELHRLTTDEVNSRFENNEVFITKELIQEFEKQLQLYNVQIVPVSGSWGREFNQLVGQYKIDFIISSETIYSPDTLPVVAESIKNILENAGTTHGQALIAAKNIYFGVGGSVVDFLTYLNSIKNSHFEIEVKEIADSSLRRSLITIEYK